MKSIETIARSGEYLVAHVLETHDIRVSHANVSGHDLWCRTPTGRLVSVQVKTSATEVSHHASTVYDFSNNSMSWTPNVYAFVALDKGFFLCEASMSKRRKIRAESFTKEAMDESIKKFFY